MNVIDLMVRLGGETLNNKVRVVVDGKIVVLARMIGTEWEYTPEGQELANKHSNQVVAEAKATRTRKPKDVPVEPVAVELANVEPEL
jgi:hypothetical protein